jgi:hypothetical protein
MSHPTHKKFPFKEHKGSLLCSQKPKTGPCISHKSIIHTFKPYSTTFSHLHWYHEMVSSSQAFDFISEYTSHQYNVYYMPCTSHPPWFYHTTICGTRKIIKFLIFFFSLSLLEDHCFMTVTATGTTNLSLYYLFPLLRPETNFNSHTKQWVKL